jgi:excisionase family DNA binding protein
MEAFPQLYRRKALAKRLGISERFVATLLARREFETVRIGSAVLVSEQAVLDFLERHRVPARDPEG